MTAATHKTFHYRAKDKRVIAFRTLDAHRFEQLSGPLIYTVSDARGLIRYVGRHLGATPLRSRWVRHGHLHHQESSRNAYIAHLEGGHGELTVACASAAEIHAALPVTRTAANPRALVDGLEALWIHRHRSQLWNSQARAIPAGFTDGLI
jgi:hypothetical protein